LPEADALQRGVLHMLVPPDTAELNCESNLQPQKEGRGSKSSMMTYEQKLKARKALRELPNFYERPPGTAIL
jgi:hypothetical protein